MTLEPGEMIEGKYRIVRLLGKGGMGAVYEGENARIHRKVAIKVLHAAVAAKADVVQRFEREAQAAGRIGSEHIVEVLDLGSLPSGERFMVMEFLEGESLGDRIKRKKQLHPHECAPIAHQLLEGLAAAHEAGIVHRDLKPDNVYLISRKAHRDFVKVLDFGVSKFNALDSDMSMTKTGAVMGTPYYMSPEQARGAKVDHRSDLYSIGVVLYQAITGRLPFRAQTFNELVFKIALEAPQPAEQLVPDLDPAFAALIARAMTRDVDERYQTAREFQDALAQWMMTSAPSDLLLGVSSPGLGGSVPPARPSSPGLGGSVPPALPSNPGLSGSVPPARPSRPALGSSGVSLQQSGAGPGSSAPGMGQSSPGMGQSSPQLAGSQVGLAVTAPQPRRSGLIAVMVAGLVLGIGGVALYKYKSADADASAAAPATAGAATTLAELSKPVETATPEPTTMPGGVPTGEPSAAATSEPSAAAPVRPVVVRPVVRSTSKPRPAGTPAPAATRKTPGPKPTGRTVSSEL